MASEDELLEAVPVDAVADGCTVKMKTRTVLTQRGKASVVNWELRDKSGNPIDVSELVDATFEIRMQDVFGEYPIASIEGALVDDTDGTITFTLPETVYNQAGIYNVNVAVKNADDEIVYIDTGLLSNERTLYGISSGQCDDPGPLTIQEIRLQMRDTMIENNLLDQVEYDDTEIIHAMVQTLREWNETPPPVARFNAHDYPFRYNWLMGTCGNLMRIAAQHYLRNDLQSSHGGVNLGDKAKAQPYLSVAGQMLQEWKMFIRLKKVEINAQRAFGSIGSSYYRSFGYRI